MSEETPEAANEAPAKKAPRKAAPKKQPEGSPSGEHLGTQITLSTGRTIFVKA